MEFYPLVHILFWIAVNLSPQDATQFVVTTPDKTWTWTKEASGWKNSADQSVWVVEGSTVTSKSGPKTDSHDVGKFVKAIKEHDWSNSTSLKAPDGSLTKEGDKVVWIANKGPGEKRYVIEFRKK